MRDLPVRYHPVLLGALRLLVGALALGALSLGLLLLLTDDQRWGSPAFVVFHATPGGLALWGWLWVAAGLLQAAAALAPTAPTPPGSGWRGWVLGALAHGYTALLAFSFAAAFTFPVLTDPTASASAIPTYLTVALVHMIVAVVCATIARVERAR